MKCPKCQYLGFETGDRCKNCGYDFSLLASVPAEPELPLRLPDHHRSGGEWRGSMRATAAAPGSAGPARPSLVEDPLADLPLTVPMPEPVAAPASPRPRHTATATLTPPAVPLAELPLPLFSPGKDDDSPLVTLPVAPRPPLSVRRTPDTPRLRFRTHADVRTVDSPLVFVDEPDDAEAVPVAAVPPAPVRRAAPRVAHPSSAGRRVTAAAIDHLLLASVDALVVYFTLRMASLELSEWRLLPVAPVAFFLCLIKLAYFGAFTAVGGQTIGKMAARIRVVSEDHSQLSPSRTVNRTLAGALTVLTGGIGFVPATFGDRRALHDRLARTRVIRIDPV